MGESASSMVSLRATRPCSLNHLYQQIKTTFRDSEFHNSKYNNTNDKYIALGFTRASERLGSNHDRKASMGCLDQYIQYSERGAILRNNYTSSVNLLENDE